MEDIFELTKSAHEITEQTCGHIKGGLISADDAQKKIKDAWNLVFERVEIIEKAIGNIVLVPTKLRINEKAEEFSIAFHDDPHGIAETSFAAGAEWMKDLLLPTTEQQDEQH